MLKQEISEVIAENRTARLNIAAIDNTRPIIQLPALTISVVLLKSPAMLGIYDKAIAR